MIDQPARTGAGPVLRVVRGNPDPADIAALVVALATVPRPVHDAAATSRWAARENAVRLVVPAGPGAWRASAWPR